MDESLRQRIEKVVAEKVELVAYRNEWPLMFEQEKQHLLSILPNDLIRRIEHFGSTAIPGMIATPIVDMLVEVTSLEKTRGEIAPRLEDQGYDYFWRPSFGDDVPPWYAWFIKRDEAGERTHHIHMVEADFEHWDRLLFRDYLIEYPDVASEYADLKQQLVSTCKNDRVRYTELKTDFIRMVTQRAKKYYTD